MANENIRKSVTFTGEGDSLFSMMDKARERSRLMANSFLENFSRIEEGAKDVNSPLSNLQAPSFQRNIGNLSPDRASELITSTEELFRNILSSSQKAFESFGSQESFVTQSLGDVRKFNLRDEEEGEEGRLQVELLEEILDAIRQSAREEIAENRKIVEQRIKQFEALSASQRSGRFSPEEIFKLSLQRDIIGKDREFGREEKNRFLTGFANPNALNNIAGRFAGSQNELFVAAAFLATIPFVGQGLSALTQRALGSSMDLETAKMGFRGTTGQFDDVGNVEGFLAAGMGSNLGFTRADTFNFARRLAAERGGTNAIFNNRGRRVSGGIEGEAMSLLALRNLFGLGEEDVLNTARLQRFDVNAGGAFRDIQTLQRTLAPDDRAELGRLLEIQNQILLEQTNVLETGNADDVTRLMSAFRDVGGGFGSTLTMGARIRGLNQALATPQGDFQQAFNFSTLRQLNPNASLFELREMQERGIFQAGFLPQLFENIKGTTPDRDLQMLQFQQRTGLSFAQTRQFFEGFNPEKFKATMQQGLQRGMSEEEAIRLASEQFTGVIRRETAEATDVFAERGEEIANGLNDAINKLNEIIDKFFSPDEEEENSSIIERKRQQDKGILFSDRDKNLPVKVTDEELRKAVDKLTESQEELARILNNDTIVEDLAPRN